MTGKLYYIIRPDGRYFMGPAQLEVYRWSRHLYNAKPFYNRTEAERIKDVYPEIEGLAVIERDGPHPEFEPGVD